MDNEMHTLLIYVSFAALLVALVLALVRLIRGPGSSNTIIAMDLVASIVMAYILVYSVWVNKFIYVDIAIMISLISFMGTVAISIYLKDKS